MKLSHALNAVLPKGYVATLQHHEWWESSGRPPAIPDRIVSPWVETPPHRMPVRERYFQTKELSVQIIRIAEPENVQTAVLEVVSYEARRPGRTARALFEQRQRADVMNRMNRVEIDLFRGGQSVSPVCERLAVGTCGHDGPFVVVFRRDRPAQADVYPVRYQSPLPAIWVPVECGALDVLVELQAVLDDCYRGGAYHKIVDYTQPPVPPLTPEQQAWADGLLRAAGRIS